MPSTVVTESPEEAAGYLRAGKTVAFPTETVYGLGGDATDPEAVHRIFAAKGRPADNPLIVHIAEIEQIDKVAAGYSREAASLIDAFFPGPLTIILRKAATVPSIVSAGLNTIGVRMPDHPIAAAFLEKCGRPVAAPSANRSGRPSPTTWQAVWDDLQERIDCILKGGRSPVGLESTVVDCTSEPPLVLRAGAVSMAMLRDIVPNVIAADGDPPGAAKSPGMRHRHYAPQARVEIVDRPPSHPDVDSAYIGLSTPKAEFRLVQVCTTIDAYAHELFHFFRRSDAEGVRTIYCQGVDEGGLGLALMDRLRRAAAATNP